MRKLLALLLFCAASIHSGEPNSPIFAEYCVGHKGSKAYLYLENILRKRNSTAICSRYDSIPKVEQEWLNKFSIHDDLKVEIGKEKAVERLGSGVETSSYRTISNSLNCKRRHPYSMSARLNFAYEVPIHSKGGKSVDSAMFGKYYKKGGVYPAEWRLKTKCGWAETSHSSSYFIRITGQCDSIPSVDSYVNMMNKPYLGLVDSSKTPCSITSPPP